MINRQPRKLDQRGALMLRELRRNAASIRRCDRAVINVRDEPAPKRPKNYANVPAPAGRRLLSDEAFNLILDVRVPTRALPNARSLGQYDHAKP